MVNIYEYLLSITLLFRSTLSETNVNLSGFSNKRVRKSTGC